ncbi:hypothetical protein BKA69DRAFT_174451 [Paraphysoderma sedebokerense]|nr:hypothetical protein BKA69DRAFT_174451 [Paraphysoderma sedebokerense]
MLYSTRGLQCQMRRLHLHARAISLHPLISAQSSIAAKNGRISIKPYPYLCRYNRLSNIRLLSTKSQLSSILSNFKPSKPFKSTFTYKFLKTLFLATSTVLGVLSLHTAILHLYVEYYQSPTPSSFSFWSRVNLRRAWLNEHKLSHIDLVEQFLKRVILTERERGNGQMWRKDFLELNLKLVEIQIRLLKLGEAVTTLRHIVSELNQKLDSEMLKFSGAQNLPCGDQQIEQLIKLSGLLVLLSTKLGNLYTRLNHPEEGKHYHSLSLQLSTQTLPTLYSSLQDKKDIGKDGVVEYQVHSIRGLADLYDFVKDYDTSVSLYLRALQLSQFDIHKLETLPNHMDTIDWKIYGLNFTSPSSSLSNSGEQDSDPAVQNPPYLSAAKPSLPPLSCATAILLYKAAVAIDSKNAIQPGASTSSSSPSYFSYLYKPVSWVSSWFTSSSSTTTKVSSIPFLVASLELTTPTPISSSPQSVHPLLSETNQSKKSHQPTEVAPSEHLQFVSPRQNDLHAYKSHRSCKECRAHVLLYFAKLLSNPSYHPVSAVKESINGGEWSFGVSFY